MGVQCVSADDGRCSISIRSELGYAEGWEWGDRSWSLLFVDIMV